LIGRLRSNLYARRTSQNQKCEIGIFSSMILHCTRSLAIILNAVTERIAGQGDRTRRASKNATGVLAKRGRCRLPGPKLLSSRHQSVWCGR
jgi:hypothetical protein